MPVIFAEGAVVIPLTLAATMALTYRFEDTPIVAPGNGDPYLFTDTA